MLDVRVVVDFTMHGGLHRCLAYVGGFDASVGGRWSIMCGTQERKAVWDGTQRSYRGGSEEVGRAKLTMEGGKKQNGLGKSYVIAVRGTFGCSDSEGGLGRIGRRHKWSSGSEFRGSGCE